MPGFRMGGSLDVKTQRIIYRMTNRNERSTCELDRLFYRALAMQDLFMKQADLANPRTIMNE